MKVDVRKEKIIKMLLESTEKFAAENAYLKKPKVKSKLSPKAQKIQELLNKGEFGCSESQVAKLVSLVIGEEVVVNTSKTKVSFKDLCCVVALGNPNTHTYPLGQVLVCVDPKASGHSGGYGHGHGTEYNTFGFFGKTFKKGNNLTTLKEDVRPATEAEIRKEFDKVSLETLSAALRFVVL